MSGKISFDDGAAYERGMGGWSRVAGDLFLDWLQPAPGLAWALSRPSIAIHRRFGPMNSSPPNRRRPDRRPEWRRTVAGTRAGFGRGPRFRRRWRRSR